MFFEIGSYEIHIFSRSAPCHTHRSVKPQFGGAASCSSPDAQLRTAVKGLQMCCIEKIPTPLHRRQTGLSFGTSFSQPPYPYAVALMHRDTDVLRFVSVSESFVFIESKPLIQQLGLALYFTACRSPVAQLR